MLQADESHCSRNSHRQSCAGPPALSLFLRQQVRSGEVGAKPQLSGTNVRRPCWEQPRGPPRISRPSSSSGGTAQGSSSLRQVALTECLNARSPVAEAASHHLPLTEHCIFARLTPLLGVLRRPGKSRDATQDCAQHLTVLPLFLPCIGVQPPWKQKGTASMWCRAQVNDCFTLMGVSFCFLVKAACRRHVKRGSHLRSRLLASLAIARPAGPVEGGTASSEPPAAFVSSQSRARDGFSQISGQAAWQQP